MATKKFDHAVIWNGEMIPPNTPIEVSEDVVVTENATATPEKPKRGAKKSDKTGTRKP